MKTTKEKQFGFRPLTAKERCEQALYEALPELKELGRGCVIQDTDDTAWVVIGSHGGCLTHKRCRNDKNTCVITTDFEMKRDCFWSEDGEYITESFNREILENQSFFKILGHPPKLSDWLRLLEKTGYRWSLVHDETVECGLCIYDFNKPIGEIINLNLTTGKPKDEQDWEALAKVLKV